MSRAVFTRDPTSGLLVRLRDADRVKVVGAGGDPCGCGCGANCCAAAQGINPCAFTRTEPPYLVNGAMTFNTFTVSFQPGNAFYYSATLPFQSYTMTHPSGSGTPDFVGVICESAIAGSTEVQAPGVARLYPDNDPQHQVFSTRGEYEAFYRPATYGPPLGGAGPSVRVTCRILSVLNTTLWTEVVFVWDQGQPPRAFLTSPFQQFYPTQEVPVLGAIDLSNGCKSKGFANVNLNAHFGAPNGVTTTGTLALSWDFVQPSVGRCVTACGCPDGTPRPDCCCLPLGDPNSCAGDPACECSAACCAPGDQCFCSGPGQITVSMGGVYRTFQTCPGNVQRVLQEWPLSGSGQGAYICSNCGQGGTIAHEFATTLQGIQYTCSGQASLVSRQFCASAIYNIVTRELVTRFRSGTPCATLATGMGIGCPPGPPPVLTTSLQGIDISQVVVAADLGAGVAPCAPSGSPVRTRTRAFPVDLRTATPEQIDAAFRTAGCSSCGDAATGGLVI